MVTSVFHHLLRQPPPNKAPKKEARFCRACGVWMEEQKKTGHERKPSHQRKVVAAAAVEARRKQSSKVL